MPQTFEEAFYDSTVRRAIYLERYKTGVVRRMVALLDAITKDTTAKLAEASTDWSQRRLTTMLNEISEMREAAFQRIQGDLAGEMKDFAKAETAFVSGSLNAALPERVGAAIQFIAPAAEQVYAAC